MPNIGVGEILLLLVLLAFVGGFIGAIALGVIWLSRKIPQR
jgi:hypothetical protein